MRYFILKNIALAAALGFTISTSSSASEPKTVYERVKASRKCYQQKYRPEILECTYSIGNDLFITVAGVGTSTAGITINKSNSDGDFFASFGVAFAPCVMVKDGYSNKEYTKRFADERWAYISPITGLVYKDHPSCRSAK